MSTVTLDLPSRQASTAQWAAVAFAASYSSPGTRQAYTTQLRLWFDWCAQHQLEPLADVRRPHVELYARDLEARGLAPATVALKLVVITGFYRYCVEEQLLEHSPAVHVRRPKISQESTRLGLDRAELGAFLVQAGLSGGNDHVLACLLALNALRVSEACGADLSEPRARQRPPHPAHRWQGQPASADPARPENDACHRQRCRGTQRRAAARSR
jgi:integrase/recombinase XerD